MQIALLAVVAVPTMVTIKTPVRAALLSDNFDAEYTDGQLAGRFGIPIPIVCAAWQRRPMCVEPWAGNFFGDLAMGVLGIASISTDPQAAGTTLQANFNPLCRLWRATCPGDLAGNLRGAVAQTTVV